MRRWAPAAASAAVASADGADPPAVDPPTSSARPAPPASPPPAAVPAPTLTAWAEEVRALEAIYGDDLEHDEGCADADALEAAAGSSEGTPDEAPAARLSVRFSVRLDGGGLAETEVLPPGEVRLGVSFPLECDGGHFLNAVRWPSSHNSAMRRLFPRGLAAAAPRVPQQQHLPNTAGTHSPWQARPRPRRASSSALSCSRTCCPWPGGRRS